MLHWRIGAVGIALLTLTGCSGSDTLEILVRDRNAIDAEIVDTLISVTDESSAQRFWEVDFPRLKVKLDKWKERADNYAKYADEKKKAEQVLVFAFAAKAAKEPAFKLDEGMFDAEKTKGVNLQYVIWLINEAVTNVQRLDLEARRVQKVIFRLMEKEGRPVDPRTEWPNLYKLQNPVQEIYSGKAFFG